MCTWHMTSGVRPSVCYTTRVLYVLSLCQPIKHNVTFHTAIVICWLFIIILSGCLKNIGSIICRQLSLHWVCEAADNLEQIKTWQKDTYTIFILETCKCYKFWFTAWFSSHIFLPSDFPIQICQLTPGRNISCSQMLFRSGPYLTDSKATSSFAVAGRSLNSWLSNVGKKFITVVRFAAWSAWKQENIHYIPKCILNNKKNSKLGR